MNIVQGFTLIEWTKNFSKSNDDKYYFSPITKMNEKEKPIPRVYAPKLHRAE